MTEEKSSAGGAPGAREGSGDGPSHLVTPSPCHLVIFLIGARGSGKTTVAGLLAARLGWAAVDADAELEARAGCSIRELFARHGEAHFRDLEAGLLAEVGQREGVVIATGGGAVLRADNRAVLRRGAVVWLRASPEVLWERVCADPTSAARRPDLAGGGLDEMRRLLAAREALYRECAAHAVETAGRAPDEIAAEVFAWWAARGANV